jgi:hypothetical protein
LTVALHPSPLERGDRAVKVAKEKVAIAPSLLPVAPIQFGLPIGRPTFLLPMQGRQRREVDEIDGSVRTLLFCLEHGDGGGKVRKIRSFHLSGPER